MSSKLDSHISAYDASFRYAFDNDIILKWYPERVKQLTRSTHTMLELGIGHGYTTSAFARHFARHVVIDGSQSVIDKFREQFPDCGAELVKGYFEDFDTDERFDIVMMGFVLEHVNDPGRILRQFRRFLKPDGRCFIAVPNGESLHRRFGHAAGLLDDMMELGPGDAALGHVRQYSVASLAREIEDTGYRVARREGIFLKPFTTAQMQQLALEAPVIEAMCKVGIDYPELCAALLFEVSTA
jgi:2-polyprenyl-3-methyl-5-hydroxy-6-metoxy-1,4-benzoquinol methylase